MNMSDHMMVVTRARGVNVYECSISSLYDVIEADSKPVNVRLDFDEEDLLFYCNLLTWPKPWPGTSPEKPSEKLKQINIEKRKQQPCLLQPQDYLF